MENLGWLFETIERAQFLGHKSVTTTEKYYTKSVKARQDRLDSVVSDSWKKPV